MEKVVTLKSTLSKRAYAKHKGVTLHAVQKAIKAERIRETPDGRIDPIQADKDWDANTSPDARSTTHKTAPSPNSKVIYAKERANREWALARLAKLELKEKSGKLVDRGNITGEVSKMVVAAKTRLLGMASKLAPMLAIETDPIICKALIETEILQALKELGNYQSSTEPEPTAAAA